MDGSHAGLAHKLPLRTLTIPRVPLREKFWKAKLELKALWARFGSKSPFLERTGHFRSCLEK
jgi:hypothetical protein